MKNSVFFKITILIILAGTVYYFVTPKYTFDANGRIRKNIFSGSVEVLKDNHWEKRDKPVKIEEIPLS